MSKKAQQTRPIHHLTIAIGVDVAKDSFEARALAADGSLGKRLRFGCDRDGFESLKAYAEASTQALGGATFIIAMEPTGHYGEPLAQWLLERDIVVHSISTLKTARAKELYDGTTRKTDEKDARIIVDLCRRGFGRPWPRLKAPFAALRVLSHQREQLVKRQNQLTNRIHRHLDVLFPELRGVVPRFVTKSALWLLEVAPTPARILALGLGDLTTGLRKASAGQVGAKRAQELVEIAQRSVGLTVGVEPHEFALRQLLVELRGLRELIRAVESEMSESLDAVPYAKRLLTVRGLGQVSAATLLGETGDLRDYRVAKQVLKMVGLDLVESSSGTRSGHRHISKRGRRYARHMLYMVALKASMPGGPLRARRDRLVARGVAPKKAAVANVCALVRILFALARDDADFNYGTAVNELEVPTAA